MISRSLFAAMLLVSAGLAQPPLTTIQDVLYKADGTRFAGTLTISWTSFEAVDKSAIATQVTTVTVTDGNLQVHLVPTTTAVPAANYTVKYNSDGRIQFAETWAVPSSLTPLRVRDVRITSTQTGAASATSATAADTGVTTVQESDVAGLVADLGARPLKGPGYSAGRVALVDSTGMMESVSGNPSDCVHVDGSSGPCGDAQPGFVDGDSLTGIVDGANTNFTVSAVPNPATSLALYRNGVLLKSVQDYTANGSAIQFVAAAAPQPGDTLMASYRLTGTDTGTPQLFPASQVLCSGTGNGNSTATFASLGLCNIPAGVLLPGDRVQIHFDVDHTGAAGGFTVELHWGGTTVIHRDAAALDVQMTARAEVAILAAGAQMSSESWGTLLPFAASVAVAADACSTGLTIDFQGKVIQPGESVTLRNYTVLRLP
jgi:hypothetical protein